jgi:acyl carrier protein
LTREDVTRRTEGIVRGLLEENGVVFSSGKDLMECGIDSMMMLEFLGRLEVEFGCLLELEEIVDCSSTDAVTAYVCRVLALRQDGRANATD